MGPGNFGEFDTQKIWQKKVWANHGCLIQSVACTHSVPCDVSVHMITKPSHTFCVHVIGDSDESNIWYWSFKLCYRLSNT